MPADRWRRLRSLAAEPPPPPPPEEPDYFGDGEFGPDEPPHPYPYFTCPLCHCKAATLTDGDDGPEFTCLDCTAATIPFPTPPPRRTA
jgi:hypothetical protein